MSFPVSSEPGAQAGAGGSSRSREATLFTELTANGRKRSGAFIAVAAVLFAAVFILHLWIQDADDPVFLYSLPILIVALGPGIRAALAAAALGVGLYLAWALGKGFPVTALGFASRAIAMFLIGGVAGYFSERNRALADERQLLIDTVPDAIVELDERACITGFNRAVLRLFRATREELIGSPLSRVVRASVDLDSHESEVQLAIVGCRFDGSEFPAEMTIGTNASASAVVVRDISERRAAESKFRQLLESAPDAFVIADREGHIQLVNKKAEELFGYPRDELTGRSVAILAPEEHLNGHTAALAGYLEDPEPRVLGTADDVRLRRRDGSTVPVEVSLSPLWVGEEMLVSAAVRDVTERRRIQAGLAQAHAELEQRAQELERSNRELAEFAEVVSHDLSEPLMTASLFGQTLDARYGGGLDAQARVFISRILEVLDRMDARITSVLEYARVRSRPPDLGPVDTAALLDSVTVTMSSGIEASGVELIVGELPVVRGDAEQLAQVFQNLLSNAIKFAREDRGPAVAVDARRIGPLWEFTVADNGVGIPPEYAARVFEMFERVDREEHHPGTGIGLAICAKIIDRHQGRIWVESVPGDGCTVHFTVPASDEVELEAPERRVGEAGAK
jgi:PAS domain S-box-containing protein